MVVTVQLVDGERREERERSYYKLILVAFFTTNIQDKGWKRGKGRKKPGPVSEPKFQKGKSTWRIALNWRNI